MKKPKLSPDNEDAQAILRALPPAEHPFRAIRRAAVPICAFESPDPAATITSCQLALNGKESEFAICRWNIIHGLTGMNKLGNDFAQEVSPDGPAQTRIPSECLDLVARKCPDGFILFFQNAHRFVADEQVAQAIWLCRDAFKSRNCTLVLLAPSIVLPEELRRDVVVISEALPAATALGAMVDSILKDAKLPQAASADREHYVDTLLGLAPFEAEQTLALSISKTGVDCAQLWERKVKMIEQTGGLSVYRGKETFADVGGLDNAKDIMAKTIRGKTNITALCFCDELDKALAANQSDTSGTTQDQTKVLLSYIQDNDVLGMLLLGPPGTGKTMLCKAAANEHGIPLVMLDLGAMKGSLVGQSEQNMRAAIKVVHAISAGRALFIGACNRVDGLPPELRRRFNYASLFVDLPDAAERKALWSLWCDKYKLTSQQCDSVKDDGWTGSEIRNACLKAWAMNCKLSEAALTIVPVSKSAEELIQGLRRSASGRFISASKPGLYSHNSGVAEAAPSRKFTT